jgi:hypothetical protein
VLEDVEAKVREDAAVLGRKRISLAVMAYLSNTAILPGVLYKLKLSHASVKRIDKIQASLLNVAAKKAGLTAAAHKVLYAYGGGYIGCGLKKWSDEVNIERLKIDAARVAIREHYLWSGNTRCCASAAANEGRGWAGDGEKRWSGGRHGR